jgi:hypothetical protein
MTGRAPLGKDRGFGISRAPATRPFCMPAPFVTR